MDSTSNTTTSVDAVRCFYLARMMEQKGEAEAASRWQALGHEWMQGLNTTANDGKPAIA